MNQQVFKFWFFVEPVFFSSAKFRVVFVESLKLTSRFLACVSVNFGFDWLCFAASALFAVGCVGFQNWLVFFLQKLWSIEFVKLSRLRWLCRFFAKVSFFKICVLVVCGFDWRSSFFQQAFWLIGSFAFWSKAKLRVKFSQVCSVVFLGKGSGQQQVA